MRAAPLLVLMAEVGCGGAPPAPPAPAPASPATTTATAAPPFDSVVATLTGGTRLHFVNPRTARDADGRSCVEYSLLIETGATRTVVPLFYTRTAPTPSSSGTVQGTLSRDCRPLALYRIETATGRPTKLKELR